MEIEEVLEEAKKYMKNYDKESYHPEYEIWNAYDNFKSMAKGSPARWIPNYGEFILKLTKILKI